MYYHQKFAALGFPIVLVPLILGVIALTTPTWIILNDNHSLNGTYFDLFGRRATNRTEVGFQTPQYLHIIGYIILIIGLFVAVVCTTFFDKRRIHCLAPIIILTGSVTIFLGLLFYLQFIIEDLRTSNIRLQFGYSLILMFITSVTGCLSAAYFSYTAGYIHRHTLSNITLH